MKQYVVSVVVAAVALVVGSVGTALASSSAVGVDPPADDTIVEVTGDAANGFGIEYYDGSALYPPTDSEARAECSEYDTRRARVRCRSEVRTWYRDLADMQQALDWAHAS
jgi:hypothetical protein